MDRLRERVERVVRAVVLETIREPDLGIGVSQKERGRRPLVAANWKMHKLAAEARDYLKRLDVPASLEVDVVLCAPQILLPILKESLGSGAGVELGAQNLHPEAEGAFTGEHSGGMLADAGVRYVIVGHSERRALFGEDDLMIARKVRAALSVGLRPILCIGEKSEERKDGATFRVLRSQLTLALSALSSPTPDPGDLVIAYEPVWAIGTGQNATPGQVQEAMAFIRERLAEILGHAWAASARLLYGGSASPDNVEALAALRDVDGFLVGGAGLDPDKFSKMVIATARASARQKKG